MCSGIAPWFELLAILLGVCAMATGLESLAMASAGFALLAWALRYWEDRKRGSR